jgi:hypothetical protein
MFTPKNLGIWSVAATVTAIAIFRLYKKSRSMKQRNVPEVREIGFRSSFHTQNKTKEMQLMIHSATA